MLTQRQTLTIGVLTPQALSVVFSNPFFGAFTEGVASVAEASGYALQSNSPLHGSLAWAMCRATVDGVVAIGLSDDHPEVEEIRRAGVPIVLVDSTALPEHGSIEVDDVGGARAAAEHLIALGHRDALVIGVEPPLPSRTMDPDGVTGRRLRGYREASAAIGLEIREERVVVGPASIAGGITALEGAWAGGLRATAVLADLQLGLEPPIPHVRLFRGRSAARRRWRPARAPGRGARSRDAGRARRRLQPHRPRLLPVPSCHGDRRPVAYRGWFHIDDERLDAGRSLLAHPPPGTPPSELGYRAWWGLPALPKLNTDNFEVREYLFTVAEHWLKFGIDGWRLDVPAEIDDEKFWQEFRGRCRAIRSDAYLVGEIWRVAPEWLRGDRFDALMNYPLGEAILGFAGASHLDMGLVGTHHEYRLWVRPLDGPGFAERLMELHHAYDPDVVAVQLNVLGSHDAPRLRTVLGDDVGSVRLATLLQTTLPGAPSIYYGDEIGLRGGHDPDCRRAFPWDESRWDTGLRDSVRGLLRLRRSERALRDGPLAIVGARGSAVAYQRGEGSSRFLVAVNPGDAAVRLELQFDGGTDGRLEPIDLPGLGGIGGAPIIAGEATIELPPRAGSVLRIG